MDTRIKESFGEELLRKYGQDLQRREVRNIAIGAALETSPDGNTSSNNRESALQNNPHHRYGRINRETPIGDLMKIVLDIHRIEDQE